MILFEKIKMRSTFIIPKTYNLAKSFNVLHLRFFTTLKKRIFFLNKMIERIKESNII